MFLIYHQQKYAALFLIKEIEKNYFVTAWIWAGIKVRTNKLNQSCKTRYQVKLQINLQYKIFTF